jgi:hypothetical protein
MKKMMMEKFQQFIMETNHDCMEMLEAHAFDDILEATTYLQKRRRTLRGYYYALRDMGIFSIEETHKLWKMVEEWWNAIKAVRDIQYSEN